jgi:hypothetical protein
VSKLHRDHRGSRNRARNAQVRGERGRQGEVNASSWDNPVVILAGEALEVVAIEKTLYVTRRKWPAEYRNLDRPAWPRPATDGGQTVTM